MTSIHQDFSSAYSKAFKLLLSYDNYIAKVLARLVLKIGVIKSLPWPLGLVTISPRFFINESFFMNELDEQTRPAVLKHEALHIVYHHLTRKLGYEEDPVITNLAMDIQINQEILPWQLPESGVFTHTFPELFGSWDSNNKSSRYYYTKLISLKNEMVEFTGGSWPSSDNDFDWSGISSPLSAQNLANLYPSSPHRDVLPMHRPEPQSPSDNQSANENKSSSSVVHRPQRQDENLSEV